MRGSIWNLSNVLSQCKIQILPPFLLHLSSALDASPEPLWQRTEGRQDWAPATARARLQPGQKLATKQMALPTARTRYQPMARALPLPQLVGTYGVEVDRADIICPLSGIDQESVAPTAGLTPPANISANSVLQGRKLRPEQSNCLRRVTQTLAGRSWV